MFACYWRQQFYNSLQDTYWNVITFLDWREPHIGIAIQPVKNKKTDRITQNMRKATWKDEILKIEFEDKDSIFW